MNSRSQKATYVFLSALGLYALLWALTHLIGVPQVRRSMVRSMNLPSYYQDATDKPRNPAAPAYFCYARAYAPFLIRVDYGSQVGALPVKYGGKSYFWFAGWNKELN